MFIETQDGTFFNTDKAIAYRAMERYGKWFACAITDGDVCYLGEYESEYACYDTCRNVVCWIRSTIGLEASDSAYLSKFIYSMPKWDGVAVQGC